MSRARDLADLADNSISGELDVGSLNIGGTEVIDSSRNLSNVGGLKTINSTSILGSGDISAGASTTYGDVGTYIMGRPSNGNNYNGGDTASSLVSVGFRNTGTLPNYQGAYGGWYVAYTNSVSGTWRCMTRAYGGGSYTEAHIGLWVRIS